MGRPLRESDAQAFRLIMQHRTMLAAYVRAIVRSPELAEDTLGDVSVEIARCWDAYDPSRPFGAWARGVARRVALANLRRHGAQPALLDEEVLERVGAKIEAISAAGLLAERKEALRRCVQELPGPEQALVRSRYYENRSYADIAGSTGRTVDALYVAFSRIHRALRECVQRREGSAWKTT